ncbi:hypothetical protein [Actinomyces wuliandei]|uniref:hypothetical protein n=1 Tax=Actinomyces wuliandei TaxID=2057743 RepID=UPI0013E38973|nr:hypothetical protein [Actinomyces wuliandei]
MNELLDKVNSDTVVIVDRTQVPVLATPAAFLGGLAAGAKAAGALVGAAAGGAAVGAATR